MVLLQRSFLPLSWLSHQEKKLAALLPLKVKLQGAQTGAIGAEQAREAWHHSR